MGKEILLDELNKEYDAIFLAIGANEPQMTLSGENVLSANRLLETKEFPDFKGKNVAISGGGNVAMDAARTIKRLGANVSVIYRRAEEQMPAERNEIEDAKKEGIEFLFQNNIISFDSENKEIECIKTKLVQKEGDTRLSPVNIEGSNYKKHIDYVILATGSKPDNSVIVDFEKDKYGYVKVNEKYETSIDKVYAGGDIIGTTQTVAWAARDGREAAKSIISKLLN